MHGKTESKFLYKFKFESVVYLCREKMRSYKNRGSNSAHALLKLLNQLGKRDKMLGLPCILSLFCNEFNKCRSTNVRFYLSHDIKIA